MQMPGSEIMIDTEDMEMEKLEWNGQEAFLYSSEEKGIEFSFILDGFPVYIAGRMNREECFEIAKGIRKNMTPVIATIEEIVTYEPQFIPANNILAGLVYSAKGSEVDTVIVDGKVLMRDRKLLTIDERRVFEECGKIAERLKMS